MYARVADIILVGTPFVLLAVHAFFKESSVSTLRKPEMIRGPREIVFKLPDAKDDETEKLKRTIVEIIVCLTSKEDGTVTCISLTRGSPIKSCNVTPNATYHWTFKTKERSTRGETLEWSKVSEEEPLTVPSSDNCDSTTNVKSKEDFLIMLDKIKANPRCNLLFIGGVGTGKSSLINTILTAFNQKWTPAAITYKAGTSVTKNLVFYKIPDSQVTLFDMPGIESACEGALTNLENAILGRLERLTERDFEEGAKSQNPSDENTSKKIDVIICVIDKENFEEKKRRQRYLNIIKRVAPCKNF